MKLIRISHTTTKQTHTEKEEAKHLQVQTRPELVKTDWIFSYQLDI